MCILALPANCYPPYKAVNSLLMDKHIDIEPIINTIAERIRQRRKALGLTQEKLAERAGLSVNYLAQLEISDKTPSLKTLVSLATALEMDMSDFFAPSYQDKWEDELSNILRTLEDMNEDDVRFALAQLRALMDYMKWERNK